jgi:hypothetical protein
MRLRNEWFPIRLLVGAVALVAAACGDTMAIRSLAADAGTKVLDTSVPDVAVPDGRISMDAVETTLATITFLIRNEGSRVVFLHRECFMPFGVTAEADGKRYGESFFCQCDCADPRCTGDVECGMCAPPAGIALAPGKGQELTWVARASTTQTRSGSRGAYACSVHTPIPTGTYQFDLAIYPTEADGVARTKGELVKQVFPLGTTNATVVVPVQ